MASSKSKSGGNPNQATGFLKVSILMIKNVRPEIAPSGPAHIVPKRKNNRESPPIAMANPKQNPKQKRGGPRNNIVIKKRFSSILATKTDLLFLNVL